MNSRGGRLNNNASNCRFANRDNNDPSNRNNNTPSNSNDNLGFRLLLAGAASSSPRRMIPAGVLSAR